MVTQYPSITNTKITLFIMWPLFDDIYAFLYKVSPQFIKTNDVVFNYHEVLKLSFPVPGLLRNIHNRTKEKYPSFFGGLKLYINKDFNENIQYNANFHRDPNEIANYKPYHKLIQLESRKNLFEFNNNGFSNLTLRSDISSQLKFSVCTHINHFDKFIVDFINDFYGERCTASISMAEVDMNMEQGKLSAQFLQQLNDNIAIGVELASSISGFRTEGHPKVTLAGRYTHAEEFTVSSAVGTEGVQLCFQKKINTFDIASVLEFLHSQDSVLASLALCWSDNGYTLRAFVDSNKFFGVDFSKYFWSNDLLMIKAKVNALWNSTNHILLGGGIEIEI